MEPKKAHHPPAPPPPDPDDRHFLKIGEVCEMTDTQPYVLRFWESEFPQLAPRKNRAGQRVYQKRDVDMVIRIKKLLYDEEYTISGARKKLEEEGMVVDAAPAPAKPGRAAAPPMPPVVSKKGSSPAAERMLIDTLRKLKTELEGMRSILKR